MKHLIPFLQVNVDGLKKIREWLWSEPEIPIYNGDEFDGKSECYIRH